MRQPSVVDQTVSLVRAYPRSGLSSTQGARLIDSTPPAMQIEWSPTAIARLAAITASSPDPQSRLTVVPGTARRHARKQQRHARDVAVVLAGGVAVAKHDVADGRRVEGRAALDECGDHPGCKVVRTHAGERAAVPADRRAHRVQDEDVLAHAPLVASRRRNTVSSSVSRRFGGRQLG